MHRALFASAALLLLACSSGPKAETTPGPSVPAPTDSPTAIASPVAPTAAPTILAARPADGSRPSIFLLDWPNNAPGSQGTFRPIDAASSGDIPGFDAHNFLQAAVEVSLSPDGGTLAATIATSGSAAGSKFVTIDLGTWTMHEHLRSGGYPWGFAWAADSGTLYFLLPGPSGNSGHPQISRLDVASGTVSAVARADFWAAGKLHLAPAEDALYLLGLESSDARADVLKGDPFVARVAISGGPIARLPLPGMLAGQITNARPDDDFGIYRPALALAADGKSAYVVDSASDRIVAIDLPSMTVRDDRSLAKRAPAWQRGLSWLGGQFVSTAHAKGSEYHTAVAEVTADGRYLVAAATRDEWCGEPVRPCVSNKPAGLRIVELSSMRVVLRDESVGAFALSADGRWVAGYANFYAQPAEGELVDYAGSGVQVFDLSGPRKAASLDPGAPVESVVFDAAGEHAVVLEVGPGLVAQYNEGCPKPCYGLKSLELGGPTGTRSPRIVGERWLWTRAVQLLPR